MPSFYIQHPGSISRWFLKIVISSFERSDPNTHIPKYSALVIYLSDPYSMHHLHGRPGNIKIDL